MKPYIMKYRMKISVVAMLTFTLMLTTTVNAEVNVKDYGATGNGTTDDTAAIQNAINSLSDGRDVVYFPAGHYYCAGNIDAKRAVLHGVNPKGAGGLYGTRLMFTNDDEGIYSSIPDNFGYEIRDIEIFGSNEGTPTQSGQILIDFSGQNYPRLFNVRLWWSDVGIRLKTDQGVGCYYGMFDRVDINQCYTGVDITSQANSHTFLGGRIWKCETGMKIATTTTNHIALFGVAFECDSGDYAIDSNGSDVTITGCRFENPGIIASIRVRSGAGWHYLFGNHFSSGTDILDETSPSVIYGIDKPDDTAVAACFMARNIFADGSFEYDEDSDGLADGWSQTWSNGGTHSFTLDNSEEQTGVYAQKISNTSTNNLRLYQYADVIPNIHYTLRIRVKASAGTTSLRVGDAGWTADYDYKNVTLTADSSWHTYTYSICPTSSTINLTIYLEGTTARNVWVDDVVLNPGILTSTGFLSKPITEDGGTICGDIGFYGSDPVSQWSAISNANGTLADITSKFNTLLSNLRSRGDLAD